MIALTLPLPPSVNCYYGSRGNRRYIRKPGIKFRQQVAEIVAEAGCKTLEGRISLFVAVYPASNKVHDLDNRAKSLQDALTHAGVWFDDSQIDELHMVRREKVKGGQVKVVIAEIPAARAAGSGE